MALRQDETLREAKTAYFASVLWSIGKMISVGDYPIPAYTEVFHPQPKDTRTTETIVGGLISKLTGGEARDGS